METKTIKLIATLRYNNRSIILRVDKRKLVNRPYLDLYLIDTDRVYYHKEPRYFTISQIKRLNAFARLYGTDYIDSIERYED